LLAVIPSETNHKNAWWGGNHTQHADSLLGYFANELMQSS
jgi:hypothetical protein